MHVYLYRYLYLYLTPPPLSRGSMVTLPLPAPVKFHELKVLNVKRVTEYFMFYDSYTCMIHIRGTYIGVYATGRPNAHCVYEVQYVYAGLSRFKPAYTYRRTCALMNTHCDAMLIIFVAKASRSVHFCHLLLLVTLFHSNQPTNIVQLLDVIKKY